MAQDHLCEPLICEGALVLPGMQPALDHEEHWVGDVPSDGAGACGQAYTDGALRGFVPQAIRAGWAFVVDDGVNELWGRYRGVRRGLHFCCPLRAP